MSCKAMKLFFGYIATISEFPLINKTSEIAMKAENPALVNSSTVMLEKMHILARGGRTILAWM